MTEKDAEHLWHQYQGREPQKVERLTTGNCHYVFLVEQDGKRFILRANEPSQRKTLGGSPYWIEKLQPLGLPIPRVLYSRIDHPQPFIVLNYIEGRDLGQVYLQLAADEKKQIAQELGKAQRALSALTSGGKFGHLTSLEDTLFHHSWEAVVRAHLARSRQWMISAGLFDPRLIDPVEELLPHFESYFRTVEPRAFFDDATTKNLLIHEGKLSGIVDLDWLCFGDRLYQVALVQMALRELRYPLDYVDYLVEAYGLPANNRLVLDFYTLVFCVDFMGGAGLSFNRGQKPVVPEEKKQQFLEIYDGLVNRLERSLSIS